MVEGSALFCTKCGESLDSSDKFCTKCGSSRRDPVSGQPAATPRPTSVAGVVATATGAASLAAGLPWQTIVAGETPDLTAMLSRVATPGARALAQRSLKQPGLALAATTVLDLFVAGVTGGAGALVGALPRVLAGGTTAALSIVTGTKGGTLRGLTGVVALVTALVQVVSLGITLVAGISSGAPLLSTLSMVVAIASALSMAVRTALLALRRRS